MSYEQFVEQLLEAVRECMEQTVRLSLHTTRKNNGCERKGITFSVEDINISPTIYLEEYYERFLEGDTIRRLAGQVVEMYYCVRMERSWDGDCIRDYKCVRDRIIYRLVNKERNEKLLQHVPYVEYLDLALLFYVLVDLDEEGQQTATMLIRREHLAWWQVSEDEIYRQAALHTEHLLPADFQPMSKVLREMMTDQKTAVSEEEKEVSWQQTDQKEDACEMYILTNRARNYGASVVLYPGILERIGTYLKGNYYILPSSVHEMILLPDNGRMSKEELACVVREVNAAHVMPEEFLSDQVYYYDRTEKKAVM